MKKCDFCTMSDDSGKCFYLPTMTEARERYCKEAIRQMVKALQGMDSDRKIKDEMGKFKENPICPECGSKNVVWK